MIIGFRLLPGVVDRAETLMRGNKGNKQDGCLP
jgi:hypothetical protein